ncbi:MAG: hypothetical protein HY237_06005 [Acidobacteria bacterium]|nr:hypothetical protein [Acidobacteriota bacterium]
MKGTLQRRLLYLLFAAVVAFVLTGTLAAQQQNDSKPATNPLVRLLQSKGILTAEEATVIGQAGSAIESEQRLARLLLSKGLITQEDYNQTVGDSVMPVATQGSGGPRLVPAVLRTGDAAEIGSLGSMPTQAPQAKAPAPAKAPPVIPAVAPIRVFPVDLPKREGLVPDIKIGPVRLKPYGFFKTSIVYDSSSPGGNDFPLPGFLGDTGPDAGKEFHIKARGLRIGTNFEWLDPSPKLAVTGRLEFDFEGNFTRSNNRNISSLRSSQPSIRLAWARLDYAATDTTTVFALFGQDWTPFGSSTLPSLLETTGLGIAFGSLYERAPQARFGFTHNFGGSVNFKLQPEFAIVLPVFGNLPSDIANQLAFGERQGVDSGRPEFQGRIALQFQLDKAKGVAPAQLIVSAMRGRRTAIVTKAAITGSTLDAAIKAAFPNGAKVESDRTGYSAEVQLPTRYATLIAKYWNGEDLRFYFAGQLFSTFNDNVGLCPTTAVCTTPGFAGTVASIDGSSTVAFGFSGTTPVVAPQRPVRAVGGFVNLGLPLSRIFNADPAGRNNGWTLYLHYGIDFAKARDVRRFVGAAGSRAKGDLGAVTLQYKLNSWVTFAVEQSLYRTRALTGFNGTTPIALPLYRGNPSRETHDNRTEIGTIFTF